MKSYKVVLLPGDGIGPEISRVTIKILENISNEYGFKLNIETKVFGGSAIETFREPLPNDTLEACKDSNAVLLAAIGDPKFDQLPRDSRPETGLLKLRRELGLFANIRPVKAIPSLIDSSTLKKEIIKDVDLVVVRELISGIYFGKPSGRIKTDEGERAFNTMTYSDKEIEQIAKVGFDLALKRQRKVCSIDKANVLEVSQLWRDKVNELSKNYKEIKLTHMYVDNASMQLVKDPSQFDVLLTSNLFGDILSDESAMLTGSIGMLPSASLSVTGPGLFEPVHGSAPDIADQNIANPMAMVLSAAMMLRIALEEFEAANALEEAVNSVLNSGYRTKDLMNAKSIELTCSEMGDHLIDALNEK
tara:strand:- start:107 stop:1189 length:1083 start_codon:yes stop_codon:yes gene_type:complete